MKKRTLAALSLLLVTAGCSEDVDVVRYDHVKEHWQAEQFKINARDEHVDAYALLNSCKDDKRLSDLEGKTFSVLGMAYATRAPFTTDIDDGYSFTEVTYIEGDAVYALCRSNEMEGYHAVELEDRPPYFQNEVGIEVSLLPAVHLATERERDALDELNAFHQEKQDIRVYPDTLMRISPGFSGTIEFKIGDKVVDFPSFDFSPQFSEQQKFVALGYDALANLPHFLLSHDGVHYSTSVMKDSDVLLHGADNLSVRPRFKEGNMKPMESFLLYDVTIDVDGQNLSKSVSIRFQPNGLRTDAGDVNGKSVAYLHKHPYHADVPLPYPDAVSVSGEAYVRLVQALESATSSTKSGEAKEYMYLTLLHGNLGQQFEVSYKQRSKKVDVFIKDMKTGKAFKLSSVGVETFKALFPQAFE
ncbi:hypothetical protein [Exiguobacterium alkaliphilum]|uniref:Lipoprotein n=1 Tax=Exiguobacterium alkaliphilum TaxID=1428684 RepID=A0ABT2KY79_9BACL|nr:hypothetical protein [Exiguobacterium alkaliphilum]MCT4794994.1 hypothetical protein [Exiguobacterium alkaliphilum]